MYRRVMYCRSLQHISCIPDNEFTGHIPRNKYFRLCFICIWSISCKQSKRISSVKSRDIQHFCFVRKLKIICFDDLEKVPKKEQIRDIGQNLDWCKQMYYCSEFVILFALNPRRVTAWRRTRRVAGCLNVLPPLIRLLGHVATRGKRHSKERQKT